jgi:tetratricopeptide (TPR) repeat protein
VSKKTQRRSAGVEAPDRTDPVHPRESRPRPAREGGFRPYGLGLATQKSSRAVRRLLFVLLAAVVLLVPLSPAGSWLLERAPDALLQWEARWNSGDPRSDLILGERLLARGETRPALAHFTQAASRGSRDFRLAVALADVLRGAGRSDKAADQACALLQVEPQSGRLHRILGQCQLERGQMSEGMASLEQATRLAPHDADAWIALAEAHIGSEGFRPETESVWEAGFRQNPSQGSLRYGLAETEVGLGKYSEAQALLRDLPREPVPANPKTRELYARAWGAWGTVLHRLQPDAARRAQSRRALERALALAPRLPDTDYELGLVEADDGRWEAARRSLETAIRLRPYSHPFWYHLARVDRHLGLEKQADQAEARFNVLVSTFTTVNQESKYLDAHPDDVSHRLRLARLLIEREDWDAAALHLSLLLQNHPGQPEALRLLQRLRDSQHRAAVQSAKP